MRCPKCGYISFDHLEECVKCKKNIKAVSESLHGSVFHVQAPAFLLLQPRQAEDEKEEDDALGMELASEEEYVDDDLEILIEDSPEQDESVDFAEGGQKIEKTAEAMGKAAGDHEEDGREIEIDFSQFEDAQDDEMAIAEEGRTEDTGDDRSFSLEMPAALADMSDLAPPGKLSSDTAEEVPPVSTKKSFSDFETDDLDFDLGLDDLDIEVKSVAESPKETMLSLDDIDFSETLVKSPTKAPGKPGSSDMDEDLNFDLDLGGLSIHKDR